MKDSQSNTIHQHANNGMFYRVLDHYTNLSIATVNHGFGLAEILALTSFHLTSKTIKLSISAARLTVYSIDGIFGSTETSRAISALVHLTIKEISEHQQDNVESNVCQSVITRRTQGFLLDTVGNIIALGSISKALTAYALLYHNTSQRRTFSRKIYTLYDGVFESEQRFLDLHRDTSEVEQLLCSNDADNVLVKWWSKADSQTTTIEILEDVPAVIDNPAFLISDNAIDLVDDMRSDLVIQDEDCASIVGYGKERCDQRNVLRPSTDSFSSVMYHDFDERGTGKKPSKGFRGFLDSFQGKKRDSHPITQPQRYSGHFDAIVDMERPSGSSDPPYGLSMMFDSTSTIQRGSNGITKRKSIIHLKPQSPSPLFETQPAPAPAQLKAQPSLHASKQLEAQSIVPPATLLPDLIRYMKFSTAAYGHHFMKILGIGRLKDLCSDDKDHPADHYSFAIHSGIPLNCILHSSCLNTTAPTAVLPVHHFILLDHARGNVVATFRGTLGLSDILLDVMCSYVDMQVDGKKQHVHSGMHQAATLLGERGKFFDIICQALIAYPQYGLLLTGHSLGAGVASILSLLWSERNTAGMHVTSVKSGLPPGRSMHCFAYGVPCVVSQDLSIQCKGLVTSIINGDDLGMDMSLHNAVSTISIGLIQDLKAVSKQMLDPKNKGLAESIIGKTLSADIPLEDEAYLFKVMAQLKESMTSEKLYPPGDVYWINVSQTCSIVSQGADDAKKSIITRRAQLYHCEDVEEMFGELRFSRLMITDHSPASYEDALRALGSISRALSLEFSKESKMLAYGKLAALHRNETIRQLLAQSNDADLIYIKGSTIPTRKFTDTEQVFRQESNFYYLSGIEQPDCHLAITATGESHLFIPLQLHDPDYSVWSGRGPEFSQFQTLYGVDHVYYSTFLEQFLARYGKIHTLESFDHIASSSTAFLMTAITEARVIKSREEIDIMRAACKISGAAHIALMKAVGAARDERTLHALFEYECFRNGAKIQAYTPIVAFAKNASVLHYIRNDAPFSTDGNSMILVDAGCELGLYASDITRTYPVCGKFTGDHKVIYEIVLDMQMTVIAALKPGVEWEDMHRLATRVLCIALQNIGLLTGKTEELLANHLPALFFPHGLGHFIGIDVHDCGGYPSGVERIQEPGIRYLRMRRRLEDGHVVTVEPGCYFIDALLDPAIKDPKMAKFLNLEILQRYRRVGGVRIEDDIAITADGCDNLSGWIPKTVMDIERVMAQQ